MTSKTIAPYGSWQSQISAKSIVSDSISLGEIFVSNENIFWQEMRPSEGGRYTIMHQSMSGTKHELIPKSYNVRTRVHEYGGGAFLIDEDDVYFSNFSDQQIYKTTITGDRPFQITNEPTFRFANGIKDSKNNRIIYIAEKHDGKNEPVNSIVSVDLNNSGAITTITSGADFYSSPVISPDGVTLAWIQWNHPNMPWDSTELYIADLEDGYIRNPRKLLGNGESICHPTWSPNGILYYVSDVSGWWNIHKYENGASHNLTPFDGEFAQAQWNLGVSFYDFINDNQIICAYNKSGFWKIGLLDTITYDLNDIDTVAKFTEINRSGLKASNNRVLFTLGSPDTPYALYLYQPNDLQKLKKIQESTPNEIDAAHFSKPQAVSYTTFAEKDCHAFYYPPHNTTYEAPGSTKPPLIILSHGGPTGATSNTLDFSIQYWTNRGFAILDVNYRGSTGYGTEYRKALNGNWGISDVDDCVSGGMYLVSKGLVDPEKIAIRGGSAGGFTTLACLTFTDFFKAGASYYGVSDLIGLAEETHKFESRYLDSMVGKYPEEIQKYIERSPINHTNNLSCPVILFQGLEDKIVLPNQSQKMYSSLKSQGIPVSYMEFENEQHGFRNSENIIRSLEAEFYFYSRVFGYEPFDVILPIDIENL